MKRPDPELTGASSPRRRRQDQAPRERTSLSLRADVLNSAKAIVRAGGAENLSAFVEAAIDEKVQRGKQAALNEAYARAANDPAFREDATSVARNFSPAERDGL